MYGTRLALGGFGRGEDVEPVRVVPAEREDATGETVRIGVLDPEFLKWPLSFVSRRRGHQPAGRSIVSPGKSIVTADEFALNCRNRAVCIRIAADYRDSNAVVVH